MLSPLYGQLSPLRVPTSSPLDSDAIAYIAAVESADGAALEDGVKSAIYNFVTGCKFDGIWSALKASCILAGARTLNGALVPLVGTAPTNNNFVGGDYNRTTGLKGNGSSKYINSNRINNIDPQNNRHLSFFVSFAAPAGTTQCYLGAGSTQSGSFNVLGGGADLSARCLSSSGASILGVGQSTGFIGMQRSNSSNFDFRTSSNTSNFAQVSQTPLNANLGVFTAIRTTGPIFYTSARLNFYSIGESLDLAKLDTRVSTLMTALAAAIP
jgi:hypothetical protein